MDSKIVSQEEFSLFSHAPIEYGAEQVHQLEGIDIIRKRPTLFIEDLDTAGLHRMIHEVIDNAFDEVMAGFGKRVIVEILPDSSVSVEDFGRGIPVEVNEKFGIPAIEMVFTRLFAGGKFEEGGYTSSGGLHGVGLKCLNAFCKFISVDVWRNNEHYQIGFENGLVTKPLVKVGPTDRTGTKIHFLPDYTVFKGAQPDALVIEKRLRQDAYLNPGAEAVFLSGGGESVFCYPSGVASFIDEKCESADPVHPTTITLRGKRNDELAVECNVRFTNTVGTIVWGYVNNVHTVDGGSHVKGTIKGILNAVRSYGKEKKLIRQKTPPLTESDITSGIIAVVNFKTKSPQFTSQTKSRYQDSKVEPDVAEMVSESFQYYLAENPREAKAIILHCMDNAVSREKAANQKRQLRKLKDTASEGIPATLMNCEKMGNGSELFVFTRVSSWHRLAECRNPKNQAALPMPLRRNPSTAKAHLDALIEHPDYHALVAGMGAGVGALQESTAEEPLDEAVAGNFSMDDRRYDKIVVVCDDTPESRLARANVLAFIQKYMAPLISEGKASIIDSHQILKECAVPRMSLLTAEQAEKWLFDKKTRPEMNVVMDPKTEDQLGGVATPAVACNVEMDDGQTVAPSDPGD